MPSTSGSPAWWLSTCRTVIASLPAAANSGQVEATGASGSSRPRSIARFAATAVTPLVDENTGHDRVLGPRVARVARSATPPHRSTTGRPSTYTQTAAPTSPCSAKLATNASRTPSNPGSTQPSISVASLITRSMAGSPVDGGRRGHRLRGRRRAGVLRRPGPPLLPAVAGDPVLRPLYPEDMGPSERHLALFLGQYWGGPTTYSDQRGHPRLRMRHAPFAVGPAERDAWYRHMAEAVGRLRRLAGGRRPPPRLLRDGRRPHDQHADAWRTAHAPWLADSALGPGRRRAG